MKKLALPQIPKTRTKKPSNRKSELTDKHIEIISRIADEHCSNTFGYLTKDDLKNEIWVICLEVLPDFNQDQGKLEHFLRVSVKNRLVNRFKEITKSVRSPCSRCDYHDPDPSKKTDCVAFKDAGTQDEPKTGRLECKKWKNYELSVESRNNLLNSVEPVVERSFDGSPLGHLLKKETKEIILNEVSEESRDYILNLMDGKRLSKKAIKALKQEVEDILIEKDLL